ncbi:DUF6017 domain-containing protein [Oscillospiraceae bacterium 21-37]
MAVFRVERNKGYTVMSNHHLRNKELTLKAKGLLSQMLSLPEDWDYTLMKLDSEHIRFVLDCMKENTTKIRNIKQYLRAVLFNAPSTIGNYYTSLVAHDMASGALAPQEPHDPYSFKPGESL